ncbi:MAG TPA: transposase [Acidimicrobiales bacterium]
MTDATLLWTIWQALLQSFAWAFTRPGFRRFAEWVTALAINPEEHTITQSVLAIERPDDWKAMETFAESGSWHADRITRSLARLIEKAPGRLWHGYHVSAVDDTKVHRSGKHVWGTCTFHEYTARCPNRATTVRAHNWVALGAVLENPGKPAWYLPISGRLYFRKSQLPRLSPTSGRTEPFRTKCELAVELIREQARTLGGRHLAAFDGGYALQTVVRPLVSPEDGSPRIEFLTRLRHDARLYAPPPERHRSNQKWGRRLPPPRQGGRWTRHWHEGTAFVYGRQRKVRWKEIVCVWRVSGHDVPVKAVVACVEGYKKRFTLVTSATELTGLPMVELFAARFRQEDGFRDLKQRLGWEECRAWTKNPIERTSQAQWVTMSLLRLAQFRLEAEGEVDWWFRPPWNKKKDRPSVLDVERLFRRHRPEIQQHLSDWLGTEGEVA